MNRIERREKMPLKLEEVQASSFLLILKRRERHTENHQRHG